jgi:AraC-like DNA-binding protein
LHHYTRNFQFTEILTFAESLCANPSDILATCGLTRDDITRPDGFLSSGKRSDFIEYAAEATNRPDFGLLMGSRASEMHFTPISIGIEHCRTVEDAIRLTGKILHLYNSGVRYTLVSNRTESRLKVEAIATSRFPHHQMMEMTMTMVIRFLRKFISPAWKPTTIMFAHGRKSPITVYRKILNCGVTFDTDVYAIVAPRSDFRRNLVGKDSGIPALMDQFLNPIRNVPNTPLSGKVAMLAHPLISAGVVSVSKVARLLNMSTRTLQRELAAEGTSVQKIVTDTRIAIARQYVQRDDTTGARLAMMLGYADPSVASRFMTTHQDQIKARLKK